MPWPKGKKQSPESIEKRKATFARPEVKAKMSGAKKGRELSEHHRAKIGQGLTGHTVSQATRDLLSEKHTGKIITPAQREKARGTMKEKWADNEYRQMQSQARKGKRRKSGYRLSQETVEKLRIAHRGHSRSMESCLKQSQSITGDKHYNWKGGPLPSNHRGAGWYTVKRIVRRRADSRCEFCGGLNVHGWQLDVHHVIPYRNIPISVDWACLALCRKCHIRAEHSLIDTSALQEKLCPLLEAMIESVNIQF